MAKIIEASAIISARSGDMSGIDKIAAKLMGVSKAGAQVKTALSGAGTDLARRVQEISAKLASIDNFRAMSRGLDAASIAMRKAQQDAARLRAELDSTSRPSRAMQSEYARAAQAVERATQAFKAQGQAVRQAQTALTIAGIPINQIAAQQARLTTILDRSTASMRRQVEAGRQIGQGALINKLAPGGVPAAGVRVVPAHGASLPIAEIGGAIGAAQAVKSAVLAGADLDTERAQARQAGWTPTEVERAEQAAQRYAGRYGLSPGSAMNIIREGRPTFGGSLDTTLDNVGPFFDVLTAMRQKTPNASAEEGNRQLGMIIKAGEILGYSSDPEKLKSYADFMTRMVQVHGSALRGEEVLNFAKSGKSAASGVSFDYLKSIFPTMLPELGGDRLGTASMTLRQALVGGKMKKRAAENLAELGLIDPAGMIKTADDDVMGVKASAVKGAKLIETNPLEWVRTVLVPAMDAKGIKAEDRPAMLSTLFSDRNAEYLINLLVTQMGRLEKDRATVERAKGLSGVQEALRDDPYLLAKRVSGGAAQAGQALSDPFLGPLKAGADMAAVALTDLAGTARGDASATAAGVAGGGLFGGLMAALATHGSGILLRGASVAAGAAGGAVAGGLMVPSLLEAARPTSRAGAPYRLDTWDADAAGLYERSWRAQKERLRDPEAARGRAMLEVSRQTLEAVPPGEVKAKLEGSAQVGVNVTVSPSPDFLMKVDQRVQSAVGHIAVTTSAGPGSTGRSMPEAAAPTGSSGAP